MTETAWVQEQGFVLMSAQRTLRGIISRMREERPAWVILVRSEPWSDLPLMYAFRANELLSVDDSKWGLPAQEALGLGESSQSPPVRPGEEAPPLPPSGATPSAQRAVLLDEDDVPRAILARRLPPAGDDGPDDKMFTNSRMRWNNLDESDGPEFDPAWLKNLDLGAMRGGGSGTGATVEPQPGGDVTAAGVEAQLTAQGPSRIAVGEQAPVSVMIELASEALPFEGKALTARVSEQGDITAIISVFGGAVEALSPQILRLKPPREGEPSFGSFIIRGLAPGRARVAVMFQQGGAELGSLTLAVSVVQGGQQTASLRADKVEVTAAAAPPVQVGDGGLMLIIDEVERGGTLYLHYRVRSVALNLDYADFFSKPLIMPAGGGNASTTRAYVESVYRQITERALRNKGDLDDFGREVRAIGSDLCRQLIPDDLARRLWQRRSEIGGVLVRSWEPYVPWELLQLRNPDSQRNETDERFLAEYNLVRSLNGEMRPQQLTLRDWSYVVAKYEFGYAKPVGAEVQFLREALPREYGITPTEVKPAIDQVLDALNRPDFDVLHIACHGEASHDDIARSTLVIGDRPGGETQPAMPVTVDARTVEAEANLWDRKPLVFLNACESGRLGASLTEWGGWPKTFWDRGAAAFVGTSWPVREKPAQAFADTFYRALLDGLTLAEAAGGARTRAKALGDASWLAYKVYGVPGAKKS